MKLTISVLQNIGIVPEFVGKSQCRSISENFGAPDGKITPPHVLILLSAQTQLDFEFFLDDCDQNVNADGDTVSVQRELDKSTLLSRDRLAFRRAAQLAQQVGTSAGPASVLPTNAVVINSLVCLPWPLPFFDLHTNSNSGNVQFRLKQNNNSQDGCQRKKNESCI